MTEKIELNVRTLEGHKGSVNSVAVSPDGNYVISGSWDDTVKVWELGMGRLVRTLKGHKYWVESVAVSPDGNYVISGSHDHTVKVWDFEYVELERKRIEALQNNLKEELTEIRQLLSRNKFNESIRKLDVCKKIAEKEEFPLFIKEIDSLLSKAQSSLKNERQEKIRKDIAKLQPLLNKKKFNEYINKLEEYKRIAESESLIPLIEKIDSFLFNAKSLLKESNITKIKKTVLDLGTKFARLQINEIGEKCGLKDEQSIINTVLNMIENKEIYAEYFSSSKSVAFNQQANIEEIDKLMEAYKEWEEKKVGKK